MPNKIEERTSSVRDTLDRALNLGGVFDGDLGGMGDWEDAAELTARANDHAPLPQVPDDEDALAPEDLGRTWLEQATESERSLGSADTMPDIQSLPSASDELAEADDDDEDGRTTAEYVRRQRISRMR